MQLRNRGADTVSFFPRFKPGEKKLQPAVVQVDDDYPIAYCRHGKIHLVYTSHARTVINHAVFAESAIK